MADDVRLPAAPGSREPSQQAVSAVPASIPSADLVTMSEGQLLVLDRMSDDMGYPFSDIAADTMLPVSEVRRIVRGFHALGLTGFGALYDQDGPGICGKGYWLREPGWKLRAQANRLCGKRWIWDREAQAIEARSGETREAGLDPKDESAVATPCAQGDPQ